MIILLLRKPISVALWVLGAAEDAAAMRPALAPALPGPRAQRKMEHERVVRAGLGEADRAAGAQSPSEGRGDFLQQCAFQFRAEGYSHNNR